MSSIRGKVDCKKKVQPKNTGITGVKESEIQKAVEMLLDALQLQYIRIPDGAYKMLFGRSNTMSLNEKGKAKRALAGIPDLTILLRDGRYIAIELKSKTGKQSDKQAHFEKRVGSDNYYLCRSVSDVKDVLIKYGELRE